MWPMGRTELDEWVYRPCYLASNRPEWPIFRLSRRSLRQRSAQSLQSNRGFMKLFGFIVAAPGGYWVRRGRLATLFSAGILNFDRDMEIGNQAVTTIVRGG